MSITLDRRLLVKAGSFGLAALALPGASLALSGQRGFSHGVASGEPTAQSVLLWTRYAADADTRLKVEMSATADFAKVVAGADAMALADRDHIAKVTVAGLAPNSWFFFRFIAPDGTISPVGRTRTLPVGETSAFNLAVFSCSNLPFGWFNAYGHAAARNDIDLVVHLGDYLYEYESGTYPALNQILPGRVIQPSHEIVTLADYRLRHAAYRGDPDLQRLHQLFPMIAMWDDHELTNDAWRDGAQNHQADKEGDWATRRRIAERVYREWMPVSDIDEGNGRWTSYQIGDLATLFMTESRITARDEQLDIAAAIAGQGDLTAAITKFRDEQWLDPNRQMLGTEQQGWLANGFAQSKAQGTKWQIWGQQCVMGNLRLPAEAPNWVPKDAPAYVRSRLMAGVAASKAGLPFNFDSWDGYPVARETALRAAQAAGSDLIVLSGDSHNGWACDLEADGKGAGVEFAGHSVTSPGFESFAPGVAPETMANALTATNPQLKWADTANRGYMTVQLNRERAYAHWHQLATIRDRSIALKGTVTHSVGQSERRLRLSS